MITDEELDELGLAEVENRLARGDWVDEAERRKVRSWLAKANKEQEFIKKCERASVSAALDTKRAALVANAIALLALLVSAIAMIKAWHIA